VTSAALEDALARRDNAFLAALREPRRNRLSVFDAALREHQNHPSFRTQDWVYSRELGFTCSCTGTEQEWRIDISTLRDMIPEAREAFERMRGLRTADGLRYTRKAKRKARRAQRRAKALLHQFLTREQRWDLRGSKSFTVVAQDGRTYQITEGTCNNVRRIEADGSVRWRLCLVTKSSVPTYDLMLMQKLLLETDVETFLRTAHTQDMTTKHIYHTGDFLLTGEEPPAKERTPVLRSLPDEVLDDPESWVRERIAQ
jgi:hypothetical protein